MKASRKEGCKSYKRVEYIKRKRKRKDFTNNAVYNSRTVF